MSIRPGYKLKGGISPSHLFSHRAVHGSPTEEYAQPLASPPTWRQRHMKVRGRVDRFAVATGWQKRALSDCPRDRPPTYIWRHTRTGRQARSWRQKTARKAAKVRLLLEREGEQGEILRDYYLENFHATVKCARVR